MSAFRGPSDIHSAEDGAVFSHEIPERPLVSPAEDRIPRFRGMQDEPVSFSDDVGVHEGRGFEDGGDLDDGVGPSDAGEQRSALESSKVAGKVHVVAIMPASEMVRPGELHAVATVEEEARFLMEDNIGDVVHEVNVYEDRELGGAEVVEILGGKLALTFPVKCSLPFLILHLRDIGRWTGLDLEVVDVDRRVRRIIARNKTTIAKLTPDVAEIPMQLQTHRWNRVCLDVEDLTFKAFGAKFHHCRKIVIHSSIRVSRIFFTDAHYEDHQLPTFLRVLS